MFRHTGIDLNTINETYLVDRMSKAITTRRRILAHRKRHQSKVAYAAQASQAQLKDKLRQSEHEDMTHLAQIPRLAVSAADLSDPTTATFLHPDKAIIDANSNVSESIYAPTARGTDNEAIEVPPPPDIGNDRYFECPYCFFLCSKEYTRDKSWRDHVLHDLRPYVCTYPNCVEDDRLFDSRQDWINHRNSCHRRIWRCIHHINRTFEDEHNYRQHLEEHHEMQNGDPSIEVLVRAGVSSVTQCDRPCPFCHMEYENINDMNLHIAYHLERFSMFALPRSHHLDKDEDINGGEIGSNEANLQRNESLGGVYSTEKSSLSFESQPSGTWSPAARSVAFGELRTDVLAADEQRESPPADSDVQSGTLASMGSVAQPTSDQGKYEQAEETYRQKLALRIKVLGKEHPDMLTSMNDLAGVLSHQGEYKQAEEMYQQVLTLRERVLGKEHPNTLTSMNNLAGELRYQGKYKQAEEMYQQVLALSERVLGKEHPKTLLSMESLASLMWNQGRFKEAEELEVRVIEIRKRVLGAEHPTTLSSMTNLTHIWEKAGSR